MRDILAKSARAASGGNVQPWWVYALAGKPLADLKTTVAAKIAAKEREKPSYEVYPADLWEPYRTRRFQCGEDMYATMGIGREDRAGRLRQFGRNADLFGAPVGLFFCMDRRMGVAQYSDLGMIMQTVMLLAVEAGLDTCAQEYWCQWPDTLATVLGLPDELMCFSGMALGYRDDDHPINSLRTRRDDLDVWCQFDGFDEASSG